MSNKKRKDSVSIHTCIGEELSEILIQFCAITGQSKTVALERAIEAYCKTSDNNGVVDGLNDNI
jgi:hypothetical protein